MDQMTVRAMTSRDGTEIKWIVGHSGRWNSV